MIQLEGRKENKNQLLIYFRLIMKPVSHHEIAQKREQENRKRSRLLSLKSKQEQASSQKRCFPSSIPLPMHITRPSQGQVRTHTVGVENRTSFNYSKSIFAVSTCCFSPVSALCVKLLAFYNLTSFSIIQYFYKINKLLSCHYLKAKFHSIGKRDFNHLPLSATSFFSSKLNENFQIW